MQLRSLDDALGERGYVTLFAVGLGRRLDGTASIKLAARPGLRDIPESDWIIIRETILGAMEQLRETPMDDLEIEI